MRIVKIEEIDRFKDKRIFLVHVETEEGVQTEEVLVTEDDLGYFWPPAEEQDYFAVAVRKVLDIMEKRAKAKEKEEKMGRAWQLEETKETWRRYEVLVGPMTIYANIREAKDGEPWYMEIQVTGQVDTLEDARAMVRVIAKALEKEVEHEDH